MAGLYNFGGPVVPLMSGVGERSHRKVLVTVLQGALRSVDWISNSSRPDGVRRCRPALGGPGYVESAAHRGGLLDEPKIEYLLRQGVAYPGAQAPSPTNSV